jgi:hypothetical protein
MRRCRELLCLVGGVMMMLFGASGCATDVAALVGSGTRASEMRQLEPFTRVEIRGAADTDVVVGEPQSVQIEADDNILPIVETYVSSGTLVVATRQNYRSRAPMRVHVVVPALSGISVPGSGELRASGVKAGDFTIALSGSGNIIVNGTASSVSVRLSGSGNVNAGGLVTQRGDVQLAGSGNVDVNSSESLKVRLSGSGNVHYHGDPNLDAHVSGSGLVHGR